MTETNQVQQDILKYLKLRGIPAVRKQSGQVRVGVHWIHQGESGWPDIIAVLYPSGRFLGVEIKRPGEDLTDVQKKRKAEIETAGGLVIKATCVEDLEIPLNAHRD